jgi:hypothetical protein
MLLLLLTMFVMRLSMSSIDLADITSRLSHFNSSSSSDIAATTQGGFSAKLATFSPEHRILITEVTSELSSILGAGLEQGSASDALRFPNGLSALLHRKGILFSLPESGFAENSDELTFFAKELCLLLASISRARNFSLEIRTHVSANTPPGGDSASPWELSASRASSVVRQMIDAGVGEAVISAASYVNTQTPPRVGGAMPLERSQALEILLIFPTKHGKPDTAE